MRLTLLATAAVIGLSLVAPAASDRAFAQSAPTPDSSAPTPDASAPTPDAAPAPAPDSGSSAPAATKKPHRHHMKSTASSGDEKFAHEPGTGESGPASMKASNIDSADSHSDIAPHLPTPKAGHDATADAYLGAAQRALRAHHTGEAQQALEMAETRLLDRSTPAGSAGTPDSGPQITQINEARKALGQGDMKAAHQAIQMALGTTGMGGGAGTSSSAGSTSGTPAGSGAMNSTTDTTTTSTSSSMGGGSPNSMGTMSTNSAPTGAPTMAPSGAGPAPGASAGASVGGGPAGTGTADSAGGAK